MPAGDAVLRVLPRVNDDVNEEWISDKTRYAEDGLQPPAPRSPYIRENGKLAPATWTEALDAAAKALNRDAPEDRRHRGDLACGREHEGDARSVSGVSASPNTDCRR